MRTPLLLVIVIALAACASDPVAPSAGAPADSLSAPAESDRSPWIPARWATDTVTVAD